MYLERFITEEERKVIKKNKQKENEINNYTYDAVQRMKQIESSWKHKNYKDRW